MKSTLLVKKILFIVILLLLVSALSLIAFFRSEPVQFNKVTYKKEFSIPIPDYLTHSNNLDSSAIIQYHSLEKNIFVLVYQHPITADTLNSYFKQLTSKLTAAIDRGTLLKYYPEKINGNQALIGNIRGSVNETIIYYRIALIQTESSFYEIIWGIDENIRSSYDDDMNKTIRGFRIINSKPS